MAELIFLIRHGEVTEAHRRTYIGRRCDPPLSPDGLAACAPLTELCCDRVISSPLLRARQTAGWISAPMVLEPRFAEVDFGDWEDLSYEEIAARTTPKIMRDWFAHPEQMIFPHGESVEEFHRRIDSAWEKWANCEEKTLAIVTHGGVLMHLLSRFQQLPPERQFECLPVRGAVTVVKKEKDIWHVEKA